MPGSGWISYLVTEGPFVILAILALTPKLSSVEISLSPLSLISFVISPVSDFSLMVEGFIKSKDGNL